jgi:hypothetical protein
VGIAEAGTGGIILILDPDVIWRILTDMTLTALKKEVLRLPVEQRVRLANAVFESLPSAREALSFAERERRAEEALSGSVKMIGADEFHEGARKLIDKIARQRAKGQTRAVQRG